MSKQIQQVETVTIRFVGDSGDGMQLTGTEFTKANALSGADNVVAISSGGKLSSL